MKKLICLLLCLCTLSGTGAAAAEVESGARYCFSASDFSPEENLTGICITDIIYSGKAYNIPDNRGSKIV